MVMKATVNKVLFAEMYVNVIFVKKMSVQRNEFSAL